MGYRWMGDLSFGVVAADALMQEAWPETVEVADFGYGAVYAMLDLAERAPVLERLVLIAGVARGRGPGQLFCHRWEPRFTPDDEVQARVREAGAGVIDLDHLLVIASRFGALPKEVFCIELEPVTRNGGVRLSPEGERCLTRAGALARSIALAQLEQVWDGDWWSGLASSSAIGEAQ